MATDRAPDALDTTLAIHRIEGWRPTADHVAALASCARGELTPADCLAAFRSRSPATARPRRRLRLRRPGPSLVPGTTLLQNRFDVTQPEILTELDYLASAARMVTGLSRSRFASATPDARVIHRHLFADVYRWAGEYRRVDLRRGDHGFVWHSSIDERMAAVHEGAAAVADRGTGIDAARLAWELARIYADYNHIHPFRDGNGRTGAVLLLVVAQQCGWTLDWTAISREQWYGAAADSMPARRDGRASHRPFLYPLNRALR